MRKSAAIRFDFLANHFVRSATDATARVHIANADWHVMIGVDERLCRFDVRTVVAVQILVNGSSHPLSVVAAGVHVHRCAHGIGHQTCARTARVLRRSAQRMRRTAVIQIRIVQFGRRHDGIAIDVRHSIDARIHGMRHGVSRPKFIALNRIAAIQRIRSSIL